MDEPQMAHRLVWNRTCNPKGGEGKNVQLDLHNEHLNRVFKDDINTFCVNISPTIYVVFLEAPKL